MSKSQLSRITKVLKFIADNLDSNPNFLKQLEDFLVSIEPEKTEIANSASPDIWLIQSQRGNGELKSLLEELSVPQLVKIIQENALDQSKLSHKWKTKDKLVNLIMERVSDRVNKGKIFFEYGKTDESDSPNPVQEGPFVPEEKLQHDNKNQAPNSEIPDKSENG